MFNKIKQLNWDKREDGVVFVDLQGLQYSYYIAPVESSANMFELALIDNHGTYKNKDLTKHNSVEAAQLCAQDHFNKVIQQYLL